MTNGNSLLTTTELERSYLDMLKAELAQYEASKARAAEMLTDDSDGYRAQVLAGWDHVIARQRTAIAREEARNGNHRTHG